MAVEINPGYMGIADVGGVGEVRFDSSSVNARQEIEAPDLIMGDYDHDAYVYGKIDVSGSISGPMTETFIRADGSLISLWEWGTDRDENTGQLVNTSDIDITYYNGRSRNFTGMEASSLGFSCASGDIAQFSIDVIGRSAGDWGTNAGGALNPQAPAGSALNEKLITWDEVDISGTGADEHIVSFEFSVNNNCMPIYTAGTNLGVGGLADGISPLLVNDIRVGMQTVTGSVTFYNDEGPLDTFVEEQVPLVITITAGLLTVQLNVLYLYPEREGRTNAYIRTIPFHGVELAVQP